MADEFRGLTLRIGADARPVRAAIDSIKRSAGQAQKQLNAMNKALKFDGDNAKAISSAIDLAGDKAKLAADAALKIRAAMSQADAETRKLASSNDKIYAQTQKLRSGYNSVNAELQHIHDAMIKRIGSEYGVDQTKAIEEFKKLREAMRGTGEEADKARKDYEHFIRSASENTGVNEKFKQMKGDAEALIETERRLRENHSRLNAELDKTKAAEGYRALKTQLVSWETEIRKAASEATDFKAKLASLGKNGDLVKLRSEMKRIEQGLEGASAAASKADSAFKRMPDSIQAARVKAIAFASKADSIDDAIANIDKQLEKIRKNPAFDKQAAATGNVYKALSKAKNEADSYRTKLTKLESALDGLKEKQRVLDEQGMDHSEKEYEQVRQKIEKCTAAIDEYRAHVKKADAAVASSQLGVDYREGVVNRESLVAERREMSPVRERSRQIRNVLGEFRTMGYGLYSTVTPVFAMMSRSAVQSAETVDAAYRNMRKTVNVTGASIEEENAKFEQLKQSMIDYSLEHVTSADELLNISAIGGQLGVPIDELEEFTKVVSDLSIATDDAFDTESVGLWLGKMNNVMHLTERYGEDGLRKFADSLVRLGNSEPALESDISKITSRFAGMGEVIGMTADEMLAVATAATATGQLPESSGGSLMRLLGGIEVAASGVNKAMLDIANSDEEADEAAEALENAKEKLQGYADVAGMSAEEFSKMWKEKPTEAFTKVIEGLKKIQAEGGDTVSVVKDQLGVKNIRDQQLLLGFTNTYDVLTESLKLSRDAFNGIDDEFGKAGDAAREAERKSEGFSGAMGKLRNAVTALGVALGDGFLPFIQGATSFLGEFAKLATGLPEPLKATIAAGGGLLALAGPLMVAVGAIGDGAMTIASIKGKLKANGSFVSMFKQAAAASEEAALAMGAIGASAERGVPKAGKFARALMGIGKGLAVGAAVIGIEFIVSSIQEAIKKTQDFEQATKGLETAVRNNAPRVKEWADGLKDAGDGAATAKVSIDELIEKQAELARSIDERNKSAQADIDMLSDARRTIDELANKTEKYGSSAALSAEEQGKLIAAIEIINELCGTQYEVTDKLMGKIADENGVVLDTTASIREMIRAKQDSIRMDVLSSDYESLYKQKLENDRAEAQAYAKWRKKQDEADKLGGAGRLSVLGGSANESAVADAQRAREEYDKLLETSKSVNDQLKYIEGAMNAVNESTDETTRSFATLVEASGEWKNAFDGVAASLGENSEKMFGSFVESLKRAGVDVSEFGRLGSAEINSVAYEFVSSGGDIEQALGSVGIQCKSVADQMREAISSANGDISLFEERANSISGSVDRFSNSLFAAGISAERFAAMGMQGFDNLYLVAGEDMNRIGAALDVLNRYQLDPKTLDVKEDGSVVIEGELWRLNDAANALVNGDRILSIKADSSEAEEKTDQMRKEGESFDASEYEATLAMDGDPAYSTLEDVTSAGKAFANSSFTARVGFDTSGARLPSGYYAAGGISPSAIRKNASGGINGIVTRAMLTNVGWVGEAGDEAVFHMRNAGGAIVPLSNRQHVKPFAQAVAAEMPSAMDVSEIVSELRAIRSGMGGVNIEVTVQANRWDDPDDLGRRIGNAAALELKMRGMA